MDVDQLRVAFNTAAVTGERASRFQTERIGSILDEGALPVTVGDSCVYILHVLPYSAFSEPEFIDLSGIDRDETINRIFPAQNSRLKFGLDGVHFYPADGSSRCLTMFRDGKVELLERVPVNKQGDHTTIFEIDLERKIIEAITFWNCSGDLLWTHRLRCF